MAGLFLFSCSKQLDQEPYSINYDNFYQSEEDALNAVNAVYSILTDVNQYNSYLWLIQDVASDDCIARESLNDPNLHNVDQYRVNPSNTYVTQIWKGSYRGISLANVVIEKVPEIDMDSLKRNRIVGEAMFLRALYYFNLVRLYGDLPLITKQISSDLTYEELNVPRSDKELIYDLIIDDLTNAVEYLPNRYSEAPDVGRATKGAALGLLSKVFLTLEQWQMAAQTANQVMELGIYSLYPDFADNFKDINRNGVESVFAAQFSTIMVSQNNQIVISGLPYLSDFFAAGVEIMLPTEDLLNSFEVGDYRKEVTFFDHYYYYSFDPHIWKHWDQDTYPPDETSQCGSNFAVMRYSEVLLIYAEAMNEAYGPSADAYNAINLVRERARNGDENVLPDLQGLTQDEFRDAVLEERRVEFVNEGIRWYDLVRTGNLIEYVKRAKGDASNPQSFNYVFPVPQYEMENNQNMVQNSKYGS